MRLANLLIIPLILILVSGCEAAFIEKSMPVPQQISLEQYKNKPNAYIQVKVITGSPERFYTAKPSWDEWFRNRVSYLLDRSHIFNYYTFDKDQVAKDSAIFEQDKVVQYDKKHIDYRVEIVLYDNYDKEWTAWAGLIQTFSIGLIPVYFTGEQIVTLKVYDQKGNLVKSGRNNTTAKILVSWWALPVGLKYPYSDFSDLINAQIDTLLKECVEQNVFKYN